ncbi:MAG: ATP-binding protein [Polyangiaceae bacterium]
MVEPLEQRYRDLVRLLAIAIDPVEGPGRGHSLRVALFAHELATALELDNNQALYGGLVHDLGGCPWEGNTPPELDPSHGMRGAGLVRPLHSLRALEPILAYHHDRWDDPEFSNRLKGVDVPAVVWVVSLGDTLDRAVRQVDPQTRRASALALTLALRDTAIPGHVTDGAIDLLTQRPDLLDTLYDPISLESALDRIPLRAHDFGTLTEVDLTAELLWLLAREIDIKACGAPGHSARVAFTAQAMAARLGVDRWEIVWTSLLHEVGALTTPSRFGTAVDTDRRRLETFRLVESIQGLSHLALSACTYADAYDGSTGASSLQAEAIPLMARVIAYADSFDRLCHGCGSTGRLGREGALSVLLQQSGRELDPALRDLAIEVLRSGADAPEEACSLLGFYRFFQAHEDQPQAPTSEEFANNDAGPDFRFRSVRIDRSGHIQSDLARLSELTSSSSASLEGHISEGGQARLREDLARAATGEPAASSYVTPSGRRIEIVITEDGDGLSAHVRAASAVFRSIRELAAAHRNFLQSADAVAFTDASARIVDINYAFTRLYGWRAEEVVGRTPKILQSGEHPPELYRAMRESLADPRVGAWSGEIVNRTKMGTRVHVLLTVNAVRDAVGTIVGYISNALDITARRKAEEELRERGRLLAKQNEELARLNQFKSQIVAMTSHDLRSPLASMITQLELLRQSCATLTPVEVERRLAKVEEIGHRLVSLTSDLVDLDKCESGQLKLHRRRIHADGLLETVALNQGASCHLAPASTIPTLSSSTPLHLVVADPERLEQVLTNLVSNALKVSPDWVELSCEATANGEVRFSVDDRGPGIPTAALESVFDRYQQLDQGSLKLANGATHSFTSKPNGTGFGLGLAIVRHIAELHGGRAWAANRPQGGCRFSVSIPAYATQRAPALATALLVGPPSGDMETAARVFRTAGIHVILSERPADAERRMRVEAPLLCLVDVAWLDHIRADLFLRAMQANTLLIGLYDQEPERPDPRFDAAHVSPVVELELLADLRRSLTRRGSHKKSLSGHHVIVLPSPRREGTT